MAAGVAGGVGRRGAVAAVPVLLDPGGAVPATVEMIPAVSILRTRLLPVSVM